MRTWVRDLCKPWLILWVAPYYSTVVYRHWTRGARDAHLAAIKRTSHYPDNYLAGYL